MRYLPALFILLTACTAEVIDVGASTQALTPDGVTPAEENICDEFSGKAYGTCNAFCEAMDCHLDPTTANSTGCAKVMEQFLIATGTVLECCDHSDCDDGSLCTVHSCISGTCTVESVDCDDGDPCTADFCEDVCAAPPPIPDPGCFSLPLPVCGCDGETYEDACAAINAAVTIAYNGPCDDRSVGGCGSAPFCPSEEECTVVDGEPVCTPPACIPPDTEFCESADTCCLSTDVCTEVAPGQSLCRPACIPTGRPCSREFRSGECCARGDSCILIRDALVCGSR